MGPGNRQRSRRNVAHRLQPAAAADLLSRRQRQPDRHGRRSPRTPSQDGVRSGFAGVDDHYFLAAAIAGRAAGARAVPRASTCRCRLRRTRSRTSSTGRCNTTRRRRKARVLPRPEGLRRARGGRSRSRPLDRLRHLRLAGRAAASRVEVGRQLRRQLRLVDHHCSPS